MKSIESTGKTLEEAISAGLESLSLTIDDVEMEVLEDAGKGLFGLIGRKGAKVRLTQKDTPALRCERFLAELCEKMGFSPRIVSTTDAEGQIHIDITGENMGSLIGYRGATMDALQYLTSLAVNKGAGEYHRILVDVENYRARRTESLQRLADKMVSKARRTGRRVVLEPMNPYERRVLHAYLQNEPSVTTHSEGEESNRRVVITLK